MMKRLNRILLVHAGLLAACGGIEAADDSDDSVADADPQTDGPAEAEPDATPEAELDARDDSVPSEDWTSDEDAVTDSGTDADGADLPETEPEAVEADVVSEADVEEVTDSEDIPPADCGNARVETGEECDDGNDLTGDGCESDCRFSCHIHADCPDDENPCTTRVCGDVATGRTCGQEENTAPCDDRDACTAADHCTDGSCAGAPLPTWYLDADHDGFGTAEIAVCAATAPSGYVANAEDCCDLDIQVRPDQTAWFDSPSPACTAGTEPFWDYDCSGRPERRDSACGICVSSGTSCSATPSGWLPAADGTCDVACGTEASWVASCRREMSTCLPNLTNVRQRCH